jgi:2'-5' RNA ligase
MGRLAEATVRGSVWIRPEGPAAIALEQAIRSIQKRYGGPGGWPHITVAQDLECPVLELERRLEEIAVQVPPFPVRLDGIGWRDEYWRCLFVHVQPSNDLIAAHRAAREAFGLKAAADFEPHVSLLYGQFGEDRKEQMAVELGERLADLRFDAGAIEFVNAAPEVPVEEWRTLHEHPLLPSRTVQSAVARGRAGLT